MARQGKIARLPHALKEQVNFRLFNGEGAPQILPWLNSQPDAIRIWETYFEGLAASPQNLSEWRLGGHKEWIAKREKIDNLKELSAFSVDLVKAANGSLSDGAAAIASGELMVALENVGNLAVTGGSDDAEKDPFKGLSAITQAVAVMRKGDRDKESSQRKDQELQLRKDRHSLNKKQLELAEQRYQVQTVEKVLECARKPEILAILGSNNSREVKMDLLHLQLFGPDPTGKEAGS